MDTITKTKPAQIYSGTCDTCGARKTRFFQNGWNSGFDDGGAVGATCEVMDEDDGSLCHGNIDLLPYASQAELDEEIEAEKIIREYEEGRS